MAACPECGRGVCLECRGERDRCPVCARRIADEAALARERRRSRIALRRAGIGLQHEPGDPVVLREGPLRLVVPGVGGAAVALATATVSAELDRRLGVDPALAALLCATLVGICVRLLLGGVSRTAGVIAAALCTCAAGLAHLWLAGSVEGGGTGVGVRGVSDWVVAHGAVVPVLYLIAAALAYGSASGHRAA